MYEYARRLGDIERRLRKYAKHVVYSGDDAEKILRECVNCGYYPDCDISVCDGRERIYCRALSNESEKVWIELRKLRKIHIGDRFWNLVVLGRCDTRPSATEYEGRTYYLCKCICGKKIVVRRNNLITGNTKSCGCNKSSHSTHKINIDKQNKILHRRILRAMQKMSRMETEASSRVGQAVVSFEEVEHNQKVYYVAKHMRCECGGIIRYDERLYKVCEKCGLCYDG